MKSTRQARFYVSPDGRDDGPGTRAKPFATPAAALAASRARPAAARTIVLRAGRYENTALVLGPQDSRLTFQAAEGETASVCGGRRLDPASFAPVSDPAVRARLGPEARAQVVQCDLRAQGIADFGSLTTRGMGRPTVPAHLELFFNNQPMTLARWPDAGEFTTITGFTKPVTDPWGTETGDLAGGFTYAGDRPQRWAPSNDIWVHGYWSYDWADSYEQVRRLDPAAHLVESTGGTYCYRKGQRFYFLNVLEELDQPGEYYVDRDAGLLYLWPPTPLTGADIVVSVVSEPLIALKDASHVVLRGLTLEAGRGAGVTVAGGEGVLVEGCTVRNLGTWAFRVDGGTRHTVSGCEIYGVGEGGVRIEGGDRASLTPCGHAVLNNDIHHISRWCRCYTTGITASGVGMRFAHNLIHDAPHTAILFTGNDFLVENNEIHRVCLETGDAGAIYTGRDFTFRGNVIRRNFIHHMGGLGIGSIAIYMDDCVCGTRIEENILWDCQYGVLLGGGRDFVVANNIFVNCRPAISADARGVDPAPVWQSMVKEIMLPRLEAMRHHEPPYSTRHPEIADVDKYVAAGAGVPPGNNRVERNICWRCDAWIRGPWTKGADNGVTEQANLVDEDPRFADAEKMNWELRPDSPALALGIQSIPVEGIGLRRGD